jgi:hypothetical protein
MGKIFGGAAASDRPQDHQENAMIPDVLEIKDRLKELQGRLELLRGHL